MIPLMLQSVLYSVAPVLGMAAGGATGAWWNPGGRIRSYIQHFAAGVVFAAVGVEILPDVMRRSNPFAAVVGCSVGVGVMLAIRAMNRHASSARGASREGGTPWAMVVAVAVDVFVDGLIIGVGSAAGERQGILIALSLTGGAVSLGLATASTLLDKGASRLRAVAQTVGSASFPPSGREQGP